MLSPQPKPPLPICARRVSPGGVLGAELWQPIALVLIGSTGTGVFMMLRGDFLGTRSAREVETRLTVQIEQVEERMVERAERDRVVFADQIADLKTTMSDGFSELKTEVRRLGERMQ